MSTSPLVYPVYAPQASAAAGQRPSRLRNWLRAWSPVLGFSLIFVVESSSFLGSDHTSAPLQRVAEAIFGYEIGIYWETIHHIIRKTGHFMAYGVFSLICLRGFWIVLGSAATELRRKLRAHGLAVLVTFLVASADEIHQSFLPNRDGQFSDVLLDTCGAVVLGLVFFLVVLLIENWRANRSRASVDEGYESLPIFGD